MRVRDLLVEAGDADSGVTGEDVRAFARETKDRLDLDTFDVWLSSGGYLDLNRIIAKRRGEGGGTQAMQALTAFADRHGLRIVVSPAQKGDIPGTTSRTRLVQFYKKFGFVENKGRHKDYQISHAMYREPARSPVAESAVRLHEGFSMQDAMAIKERVAALPLDTQEKLADALVTGAAWWVVGDGMVAGDNAGYLPKFELLASVITHHHRKKLRKLYRGTRVAAVTPDLQAAADAVGRHRLVTSTKTLQSWSTKGTIAAEFSDPDAQAFAKGNHGVVFATRASALPIILTMADVKECLWWIVEGLDDDVKSKYSSISHSDFMDLEYRLQDFEHQNEVIVRTPPDGRVEVNAVKIVG